MAEAPAPKSELDVWELDEDLRHAARILGLTEPDTAVPEIRRYEHGHRTVAGRHRQAGLAVQADQSDDEAPSGRILERAGFLAIWMATAALACGGVLLAWSRRPACDALWGIGLEILAGGLGAMCLGMLLRLSSLLPAQRSALPNRHRPPAQPRTAGDGRSSRRPVGRRAGRTA